jgi:hypothetical protein
VTVSACGDPGCPVPQPTAQLLRRLRTVVWSKGLLLRRGHKRAHPDATALVPAAGNTRFGPLDGVGHVYLARMTFAALLESAFHDAAPPDPRLPEVVLSRWCEAAVTLVTDVRLIDLRDPTLDALGLERGQLTATTAAHYPCTRVWARELHARAVGGQPTHGLVWHSRQLELHARAAERRPALAELLGEHPAEVAVLWSPPVPIPLLVGRDGGLGPLDAGTGYEYVSTLTAELDIVLM